MTGTDTGVGKTAVTCGLLAALRRRGLDVGCLKPVETGHDGPPDAWPPDARALAHAAGLDVPRDAVVPYVFREPLAPSVAADRAGRAVDLGRLDAACRAMRDAHGVTLVEGAGGLLVPVAAGVTMADLAARWHLPLILVARAGLGTINHTVLTVEAARARGLEVAGIVLNGYVGGPAEDTNPQVIEGMTGTPVLGRIPRLDDVDVERGRVDAMGPAVERHLDLGPLLRHVPGGPLHA